ncbi:MAG TPA: universal stress protein [Candidatus Angelobacter sp.]
MTPAEPAVSLLLKNVLLATDLAETSSEKALKYAQGLAQRLGSRLHAIHVSGSDSYQLLEPEALAVTFHELRDASQHPTDVLKSLFQGLPTQISLRNGGIWEVINDVVARTEIDLLVLGTHGRTGIPKLIQGSVAEQVFRNVSCPVLTVGPDAKVSGNGPHNIERVLLATDLAPNAASHFYAGWFSKEFQAKMTVMRVMSDTGMGRRQQLVPELKQVISGELNLAAEPECRIEYGPAAPCILEVARAWPADLIVLGARHPKSSEVNTRSPWAVASRVIAEAECPVLTVRQPE